MKNRRRLSRREILIRKRKRLKKRIICSILILSISAIPIIKILEDKISLNSILIPSMNSDNKDLANDYSYEDSEYYIEKDNIFTQMFSSFNKNNKPPPKPQDALPIREKFYSYRAGGRMIQNKGKGLIKNSTDLGVEEVQKTINEDTGIKIKLNSNDPQVLIMHTHTTESFEKFDLGYYDPKSSIRSTDESMTVVAAGASMKAELEKVGIKTIQDKSVHDKPKYSGAYDRSRVVVEDYLKKHPSIKIVLDVHRDAIQTSDGTRYKPTAVINGKKAAQIMLIAGATGKGINIPNYKENLKFASKLQNYMESSYEGLTRPILFDYRHYNQDLTTGSILVEVGGHGNTISEAIYSGQLVGISLANMLKTMI